MKITVISDTHNQHEGLGRLSGDVLIHCGDMLDLFDRNEGDLRRVDEWFGKQDFDLILCIGGNHDLLLEEMVLGGVKPFENAIYLQDQQHVHNGVVFYGAPWIPQLFGHAFYQSDSELRGKWSLIPDKTDVLLTHTPPIHVLDGSRRGIALGCPYLAASVDLVAPKLHCFGHVHHSAGLAKSEDTIFVNASSVNNEMQLARQPFIVEVDS